MGRMHAIKAKMTDRIAAIATTVFVLIGMACIVGGHVWLIKHLHH
jgi:hypothetical protein